MIEAEIGDKTYRLLIDTGARMVFFDQNKRDEVASLVTDTFMEDMDSASPDKMRVESGTLAGFRIGELEFGECDITFADLAHMQRSFGDIDGIVGYPILSRYKTVISWSFHKALFLKG